MLRIIIASLAAHLQCLRVETVPHHFFDMIMSFLGKVEVHHTLNNVHFRRL